MISQSLRSAWFAGHPSTLIVPLTTTLIDNSEPLRIRVEPQGQLERQSDLLIDQLRAIDNTRLIRGPLTRLENAAVARVDQALREVVDLTRPDAAASTVVEDLPPQQEHG